ncbi:MAG: tRNA (adenosine(37)-N6)-dimethylallyltransferase MiaA [Promicromonosporaceae bacterium]|nr:tRNA (adenosine(37)-N6)-dimethylallyltransferase MiaA [Promicromonosporaceae bacterium]
MIIAIVGPTATGKSDLALDLAEALTAAEIVNADAYQRYRGMDVGTAKVPPAQRRGIPHHQLDVLDPHADSTVAEYQAGARADLAAIAGREHRAIVVGGSGLYVKALLDHMDFPGTDPAIRSRLEARVVAEGRLALHAELARRDPEASARIDPHNARRIVRALEVIELTGRPFTAYLPREEYVRPTIQIGLDCSRDLLDRRVTARVDQMFAAGLVEEVRALASPVQGGTGAGLGATAARAVGYAETLRHLAGEVTADEAREHIVFNTRRLARKQMGWFGRDARVHWLQAEDPNLLEQALALVTAAHATAALEDAALGRTRRPLGSPSPGRP